MRNNRHMRHSNEGLKPAEKPTSELGELLRAAIESEAGLGESERGAMTEKIFRAATAAALDEGDAARGREQWEAAMAKRSTEAAA
jgi:hypothetical protein